jgi:hypothetical protein
MLDHLDIYLLVNGWYTHGIHQDLFPVQFRTHSSSWRHGSAALQRLRARRHPAALHFSSNPMPCQRVRQERRQVRGLQPGANGTHVLDSPVARVLGASPAPHSGDGCQSLRRGHLPGAAGEPNDGGTRCVRRKLEAGVDDHPADTMMWDCGDWLMFPY